MATNLSPDLRKILRDVGCTPVRQGRLSDEIWYSLITDRNISVDAEIKSRRTANGILKRAGLPERF